MKILENKPVSMAEAKETMTKLERKKELSYEQKLALEHLKKHTQISADKAKKIAEEINGFIRLSPEVLAQIINIMPKNIDELRLIVSSEKFVLKEEELNKILEILKKN
jgi:DNA-directed RNA polymerase subunit F